MGDITSYVKRGYYMSMLKAGFAQIDITPEGGPVSLNGQFEVRITTQIQDPIMAVAMVLEREGERSIWVSIDSGSCRLGLTRGVERLLGDRLPGFRPEQLVIAATHIHTGPYIEKGGLLSLTGEAGVQEDEGALTSVECCRQLVSKVAEVVETAWKKLEVCEIEVAVAPIITGVNRRVVYQDGTARMYGELVPESFLRMESRDGGPSQFLYVYRKKDRKLLGVVADVPCPAQCDERANYISGDYWGVVRREVAAVWGTEVSVLGLCRAAGDLSPHAMIDRIQGYNDMPCSHEKAEVLGSWIAENIISHKKRVIETLDSCSVLKQKGITAFYELWPVSEEEYKEAKEYLQEVPVNDPSNSKFDPFTFANSWVRVQRVEKQPKTTEMLIRATRIGNVALLSLPGEVYIEYADRIRVACQDVMIFDVQLACSYLGYLATKDAVKRGHYSANIFNCYFAPEEGDKLVEDAVALIKSLFE